MKYISCKAIRDQMLYDAKNKIANISTKINLVIIQVEGDDASEVYIRNKIKTCEQVGINVDVVRCSNNVSYEDLRQVIIHYTIQDEIDGVMLQLPLPEHLKSYEQKLLDLILWRKDVDGLSSASVGRLWSNLDCITPATPTGIMKLLPYDLSGQRVLIINRSNLVGKPLAKLLMDRNATVTIAHSKTGKFKLRKLIHQSDIIVTAIGRAHYIDWSFHGDITKSKIWIDVSINRDEQNKLCGDISTDGGFELIDHQITPVPGGVGVLTTAQLVLNTIKAYELGRGRRNDFEHQILD